MADSRHLLLDIGNTNIKIGFCSEYELFASYALPTKGLTSDLFGIYLINILEHTLVDKNEIELCIASSVVPSVNYLVRQACSRFLNKKLLFVNEDISLPLENRYQNPYELGTDRLVASYASRLMFPAPRSLISVDFGTATTFDCLTDNTYLGGLICPGLLSSAQNLTSCTAKLPQINIDIRDGESLFIGRDTASSLNYGFIFGFAALSEGIISRLKKNLIPPLEVVATGGLVGTLLKVTECFDHICPDLVLEGLRFCVPLVYRQ